MQTLQVHTTQDYNLFKSVGGNRNINELHKNRLKRSMQEKQLINPIIVNEKHEIIDGQHRFNVCKELELPVYYLVVSGYGLEDVQRMNQNSKNWSQEDFLAGYCDMGMEDYILFKQFKDQYDFGFTVCLSIALNINVSSQEFEMFKNGDFKFSDYSGALERADKISALGNFTDLYNTKYFVYAMITLFKNPKFNYSQFLQKLSFQPNALVPCTKVNAYITLIEDIYNFRSREKVSLRY